MDADDSLLSELLALLESGDEAPAPPTAAQRRSTKRPPSKPTTITDALRAEVSSLTRELARLRSGHQDAKEPALIERRKRQRAERECEQLRAAVYQHTRFVRGLDAIYCIRPRFSLRVNLCRHLHRHVRLPRDLSARWGDFDAASHDTRLHSAVDILCHETALLTLSGDDAAASEVPSADAVSSCEPVDDGVGYSVTTTSVYTIKTRDFSSAVRGACVAMRDEMRLCPQGHSVHVTRDEIVDADASASRNILYRIVAVNHRNAITSDVVELEVHLLTSYKITDGYAVVLWDFVDDDQLHPLPATLHISREVTGAQMCSDGVERTVVRSLSTNRFRFHDGDVSLKYGCVSLDSSYANETLFRTILQDQVATDEALVGKARALMEGLVGHDARGGHPRH